MLYYLLDWINDLYDLPGFGVFQYLTFRAILSIIFSLIISLLIGRKIIDLLRKNLIGEVVRDNAVGPDHASKAGTPTMGGLIIIAAVVIPTLLWGDIKNGYVWLILLGTIWMGTIGFVDDYIKVFKKDKAGLKGKFKIVGQVTLGLIVALTMLFHPDYKSFIYITDFPFFKDYVFDYSKVFLLIVIFIITAVSNGVNLTDGIDGLAAGTTAIVGAALGVFAYLSGNYVFSDYLNISYIPLSAELIVYAGAMVGGCLGFLWYNGYPAQVFMGDTGSLALGGAVGILALMVKKELLIPIFCGVFLAETLSVMLQVSYFKYTKKKYGEGKRIFLMAPLHHHYEKKGLHEAKITNRFFIVAILMVLVAFATLKLR
ncbi:UNVERIFIED_CONTAM: hypothetical protein GTU68_024520 [Idotea baltica]|nr:hypothetical protein [Idotea baltica]